MGNRSDASTVRDTGGSPPIKLVPSSDANDIAFIAHCRSVDVASMVCVTGRTSSTLMPQGFSAASSQPISGTCGPLSFSLSLLISRSRSIALSFSISLSLWFLGRALNLAVAFEEPSE